MTNPLSTAVSSQTSTNVSTAYEQFASRDASWENTYKKIGKLLPNDASTQLPLAQAATDAADTATEIAAYKAFLKLAPNDASPVGAQGACGSRSVAGEDEREHVHLDVDSSAASESASTDGTTATTTTRPDGSPPRTVLTASEGHG